MVETKSHFNGAPSLNATFQYRYKSFNWIVKGVLLNSIGFTILTSVMGYFILGDTIDPIFIAILGNIYLTSNPTNLPAPFKK